ncbi:MAG: MarR family transcriptional regulator [Burkholderiaceae bacterium]|nr:MarR family transcriptional regulator [Burkholderiaceae bacterium]
MSRATRPTPFETFVERVGVNAEAQGMPRIAGRMMAFFVLHGGPFSFAELAGKLNVSRGSVSTNARLLAELGVIERVGFPGDRQDYYQLAGNPYTRLIAGHVALMREMQASVEQAVAASAQADRAVRRRLQEMLAFYQVATRHMEQLIEMLAADANSRRARD